MAPPLLEYSMLKKCVSPRRAPFQNICCFIEGKHHFSTQAFRLGHIHVFKFMRCFAMAKQHFQYAHVNHKGSMGNDGETTLEKGMCMPVGFLHEKGVTSCWADGFQICWSRHHLREQGSKYGRIYRTSSNKVSNLLFFTSL